MTENEFNQYLPPQTQEEIDLRTLQEAQAALFGFSLDPVVDEFTNLVEGSTGLK